MKTIRFIHFLLVGLLFAACRPGSASQDARPTARACYDQALAAFGTDSTQQGELLLQQAMQLAGKEQDLHTLYLSQIELAKSLSWSNTEAALDMARRALQTYERRPDSERNHIIILDYIGTYASQQAYDADSSFDEALRYTRQAHELALASSDSLGSELVSQTLTSLANIYWAMDDYPTHELHGIKYRCGHVSPFGATILYDDVVNFSVFSKAATACELLLYHRGEAEPYAVLPFPEPWPLPLLKLLLCLEPSAGLKFDKSPFFFVFGL